MYTQGTLWPYPLLQGHLLFVPAELEHDEFRSRPRARESQPICRPVLRSALVRMERATEAYRKRERHPLATEQQQDPAIKQSSVAAQCKKMFP